jgi:hypothetical protein
MHVSMSWLIRLDTPGVSNSEALQAGSGAGAAGGGLPAGAGGGQAPAQGLGFAPGQDQQVNKVRYTAAVCSGHTKSQYTQ